VPITALFGLNISKNSGTIQGVRSAKGQKKMESVQASVFFWPLSVDQSFSETHENRVRTDPGKQIPCKYLFANMINSVSIFYKVLMDN
jgi:hypothetical protein